MAKTLSWRLPFSAMGKPRMTQRDRWRKRPCVEQYRLWCDEVREHVKDVPPAEKTLTVWLVACFEMPKSWSKKKKAENLGCRKRTTPDGDNCMKAILDCLWKNDAAVGDLAVSRWWAESSSMKLSILAED